MAKRGRKHYEITPELLKRIEQLGAQGLNQEQICLCIGWNVSTICRKKLVHKELNEAIKRGKAKGLAKVTGRLLQKVDAMDTTAMIFYLKKMDKETWGDEKDTSGNDVVDKLADVLKSMAGTLPD